MKKIIHRFSSLFLFLIIASSCSSSDESIPQELPETFNLLIENEEIPISRWEATRIHNSYSLVSYTDDDRAFIITFNGNGRLSFCAYGTNITDPSSVNEYSSSTYYSSNSFEITDIRIDEDRVSLNFNGTLYNESDNIINSQKIIVNNSEFSVDFEDKTTESTILTFQTATVNGIPFERVYGQNRTDNGNFSSVGISDGPEVIAIHFDKEITTTGTYNFSSNQDQERVSFKTINPYIPETKIYETSGTLIIEEISRPISENDVGQIKGSYEFTATIENETINVLNGEFNLTF
ncbi:hypothetical protein [uncultured Aquimarina sp.]|uniref:hypothetical protein n=1 Tax=uncultured Aquimarina sp. TaxID=575652 RepID=UPI002624DE92|nr:hypothetical protein [uncultured Aquimarina sp.]